MPVYVYRCEQCGSEFEKRQSFSDAPLIECEACHGTLRKVLTPAVVIYKGSGFYSTDHNGKSGGSNRNGSNEKSDGSEGKSESSTGEPKSTSNGDSKETAKAVASNKD